MTTIRIQGMSCAHCAATVHKALEELGLTGVQVDAAKGEAVFAATVDQEDLRRAIAAKGYQLVDWTGHAARRSGAGGRSAVTAGLQRRRWCTGCRTAGPPGGWQTPSG